jgi:hypothetical protein
MVCATKEVPLAPVGFGKKASSASSASLSGCPPCKTREVAMTPFWRTRHFRVTTTKKGPQPRRSTTGALGFRVQVRTRTQFLRVCYPPPWNLPGPGSRSGSLRRGDPQKLPPEGKFRRPRPYPQSDYGFPPTYVASGLVGHSPGVRDLLPWRTLSGPVTTALPLFEPRPRIRRLLAHRLLPK